MEKIGFIGLGQMGKPMAANLIKAGFSLAVYNRTPKTAEDLGKSGALVATSPAEVAKESDVVITSLPNPAIVNEIILGREGVARALRPNSVVIDTSTIGPRSAVGLEQALRKRKCYFLDAPVSGGPEKAKSGTLTIMIGGNKRAFQRCKPIFNALGQNIFFVGPSGSGQGIKLVNQILVGIHTLATAEAMHFGASLGLDPQKVVQIIQTSAGDSFMFRRTAPRIIDRDFSKGWQTYLLHKDLRLVLESLPDSDFPMRLTLKTYEIFSEAVRLGFDHNDPAIISQVLEKLAASPAGNKRNAKSNVSRRKSEF